VDRETEDIEDIENIEYASTQDSDDDLKDKIVAALHEPGIEVMVVDGTALLEGEVSDDYAKVRAEAVAKLYARNVVNLVRVAKAFVEPPPAPPLPPSELPRRLRRFLWKIWSPSTSDYLT